MFWSKIKKIFTNQYGVLTLSELKINPDMGIIDDTDKSINDLMLDVMKVQDIIATAKANKKIKYFYVIHEDIGDELNVKDMQNFKGKLKSIKKVFGKSKNVYFFVKNTVKTDLEAPTLTDSMIIPSLEPEVMPVEAPMDNLNLPPLSLDQIDAGETMVSNDFIDGILNSKGSVLDDYDRRIQEALAARRKIIGEAVEAAVALEKEKIRAELEISRQADAIRKAKELALAKGHAIRDENGDIKFIKDVFEKEYLAEANEVKIAQELFYATTGADRNEIHAKIYTLKSIIDFIWRMYIVHFDDSQIEDLLYYTAISIPTIARTQSDFVRKVAQQSNSLFDLMVKLDHELKYEGALFYVFLASLFIIKDEKVYVNRRYLNSITFIQGDKIFELTNSLEKLVNEIDLYKEKIIYSHYVEFANFYKSEFAKIRASLKLSDIQQAVDKRNLFFRRENIFIIILNNITLLAAMKSVDLGSVADNPELVQSIDGKINQNISKAYIVLLSEIKNYMLLNVTNYETIFEIYNELLQITIDLVISDDPDVQARAITLSESIKADLAEIVNYELDMKEKIDVKYDEINNLYKDVDWKGIEAENKLYKESFKDKFNLNEQRKEYPKATSARDIVHAPSVPRKEPLVDETDDLNAIVFDFEERIKQNIKKIEEERARINQKIGHLTSDKDKKLVKVKAN